MDISLEVSGAMYHPPDGSGAIYAPLDLRLCYNYAATGLPDHSRIKKVLPNLTIVLGGAASGKSAYAETLIESTGKSKTYLATAQAFDAEMGAKIDRHKTLRGNGWKTIETPLDVGPALSARTSREAVLLDCATMWLSNQLMAGADIAPVQTAFLNGLSSCPAPVVIVSNEVGHGIVPDNALARQFREAQGRLNIALAAQADLVVLVVAGLPLALKGHLP
jgi:adenosylcobinamide kinase/adenosylcobinamide-phosphate guanylyltransferase